MVFETAGVEPRRGRGESRGRHESLRVISHMQNLSATGKVGVGKQIGTNGSQACTERRLGRGPRAGAQNQHARSGLMVQIGAHARPRKWGLKLAIRWPNCYLSLAAGCPTNCTAGC